MFKPAFAIMRQHRQLLATMCWFFYGVMVLGMVVTLFVPSLGPLAASWYDLINTPLFKIAGRLYGSGDILGAAAFTFVVNLGVAVLLTTLPSLIVPFVGLLAVLYRFAILGPMLAPFPKALPAYITHYPTLVVEMFAYLLAGFAAYLHGQMVLHPERHGCRSRGEAWVKGLPIIARLYVVIVVILAADAFYEAIEVIKLAPILVRALA